MIEFNYNFFTGFILGIFIGTSLIAIATYFIIFRELLQDRN